MSLVLDRNLVLAAGAGSGKTHALVTVALGLYAGAGGRAPVDPGRVWAVTFTEKAAAELRQRIADRALKLAHNGGDLAKEPDLAALLGARRPSAGDWERIARALSTAPIGTFHSLCGQLLRAFAAEARLDPRFAILDERQGSALFERAREEVLLERVGTPGAARRLATELGGLDPVRDALGFLHGKLAEEGRDARSLLTNGAFDRQRASARLGDACGFLSLALQGVAGSDAPRLQQAVQTLARERSRIGRCLPEAIAVWYPAVAAVLGCSTGRGPLPKGAKEPWGDAKASWERLQSAWASARQASIAADLVEVLEEVSARYAAEKRRAGGLDFADLIRQTRDLLRDDHDVRGEAKRRISALLVDEFQDTNGVQLDLVRLLAEARDEQRPVAPGGSCAALPLEPAVFCAVGDRKQSIYEFRGADVALFADLTARARAGKELRLEALTRSWRSRPGLVHFANGIFGQVLAPSARAYEVGWFPEEDALAPQRTDGPAYADRPAVQLLCGEPGLNADERRPYEARLVAAHVEALLRSGRQVEEKGGAVRQLVGADVALLFRSFASVGIYQEALAARGIPSLVVGGRGFFGAREIRDLAALLLAICDPWDRFASAAVLRSPLGGVGDDALVLLETQGRLELGKHGEGCAAELPADEAARVGRIGALVRRLSREIDRLGPAQVLRLAIDALGLRPIWAAAPQGEQRLANVEKLLRRLEAQQGLGALAAVEEMLERADDPDDREAPADVAAFADARAVRILTVHASKGLEFPVVVLPELSAGSKNETDAVVFDREKGLAIKPTDPLHERIADEHAAEVLEELKARRAAESRRLFYVAVTRARDLLVLCGEKGKGGTKDTWRHLLDEAMGEVQGLVEVVPPLLPAPGTMELAEASSHVGPDGEARGSSHVGPSPSAEAQRLLDQVAPLRIAPGRFVAAVTELAELLRCERRYFYKIVAGLEEHAAAGPLAEIAEADEADLPGIDRLARGQLAHRLLECVDYARSAEDAAAAVREVVLAEGLDPAQPEVEAIAADAVAFVQGPLGRKLAATPASRIYRELPFALELQGPGGSALALRGQIDLLFVDDAGTVHLVDYKHASGKGQPADAYGFQLRTYALAAARILPGASPLRVGIAWLKDRGAEAQLQPVDRGDLDDHAARLAMLGDRLGRARAEGTWRKLEGPAACGDCGFKRRCWESRLV
ncbi:UvrD-helicase domain-containing protein [Vulgatibacter sp.]|uniref:UvrD-helicase domain-containing protein n=1 Tax=Vulgatibacter sp. TaxID=1971226 RepID=UPI00356181C6